MALTLTRGSTLSIRNTHSRIATQTQSHIRYLFKRLNENANRQACVGKVRTPDFDALRLGGKILSIFLIEIALMWRTGCDRRIVPGVRVCVYVVEERDTF